MSDDNWNDFTIHLTGDQAQRLLHHGHWVPVLRGYTARYVDAHFPGWTWNDLLEVMRAAGVVVRRGADGPLRCDDRVEAIHFDVAGTFAVEWIDGTTTNGETRFAKAGSGLRTMRLDQDADGSADKE